jgi:hypothetical protein
VYETVGIFDAYLNINSTTDEVSYIGMVSDTLLLSVVVGSYQRAIDILKEIKVISREEYQVMISEELMNDE